MSSFTHPWRLLLISAIFDRVGHNTEAAVREFVEDRQFVAFHPALAAPAERAAVT